MGSAVLDEVNDERIKLRAIFGFVEDNMWMCVHVTREVRSHVVVAVCLKVMALAGQVALLSVL